MTQKSHSSVWILLFFFLALFSACGGDKTENQPPNDQLPKLITKKWHLDSAHYRGLYRRYIDVLWDKFKESEKDAFAKNSDSDEEIKIKRALIEASVWQKCNEEIEAMYFDFRAGGTYDYNYRGGGETGSYSFSTSFDTLRLKPKDREKAYSIRVASASDSILKLEMNWPIVTAPKDSDERIYEVEAKYIPIK